MKLLLMILSSPFSLKFNLIVLQGFMEDCPDGRMDKDKMQIMFKSIIPEGEAGEQFLEQLFRIFDKDGNGSIDFKVWSSRCEG